MNRGAQGPAPLHLHLESPGVTTRIGVPVSRRPATCVPTATVLRRSAPDQAISLCSPFGSAGGGGGGKRGRVPCMRCGPCGASWARQLAASACTAIQRPARACSTALLVRSAQPCPRVACRPARIQRSGQAGGSLLPSVRADLFILGACVHHRFTGRRGQVATGPAAADRNLAADTWHRCRERASYSPGNSSGPWPPLRSTRQVSPRPRATALPAVAAAVVTWPRRSLGTKTRPDRRRRAKRRRRTGRDS